MRAFQERSLRFQEVFDRAKHLVSEQFGHTRLNCSARACYSLLGKRDESSSVAKASQCKPASVLARRSSSRDSRLNRAAQPKLRSTTQRRGSSTKPFFASCSCTTSSRMPCASARWRPSPSSPAAVPACPLQCALCSPCGAGSHRNLPDRHSPARTAGRPPARAAGHEASCATGSHNAQCSAERRKPRATDTAVARRLPSSARGKTGRTPTLRH